MTVNKRPPSIRRTQSERSEIMRRRLIDATISCLESDGYSGTTMSRIIETAGVSRGAPLHHFPNKQAIIAAAAEELIIRVSLRLGNALDGLDHSENPLKTLVKSAWSEVFNSSDHVVLLELLVRSRHESEIAKILQDIWQANHKKVVKVANRYFESTLGADKVSELMVLTQWLLRGIAEDKHIIKDDSLIDQYIDIWCQLLSTRLQVRTDI